jgi:hypothetical protein
MNALTAPKCLIVNVRAHKVFTIILQRPQVTQAMNLPKAEPKQIIHISCDQLTPSMAIVLFSPCLAFGKGCEHSNGWATIQTRRPHQKQLARIRFFAKG